MNPPPPVPESTPKNADDTPSLPFSNPDCPFCTIITAYPAISPLAATSPASEQQLDPQKLDPPAFVLLSTEHVVVFFDVYPLTRGHVLVCPRRHAEKVGDLSGREGAEVSVYSF
jgi:diadenosine tetraphosphate (Ap4A) HIT family hydrolase